MRFYELFENQNEEVIDLDNFNSMEEVEQYALTLPVWRSWFKYWGWGERFDKFPDNWPRIDSEIVIEIPSILIEGPYRGKKYHDGLYYDLEKNSVTKFNDEYTKPFPTPYRIALSKLKEMSEQYHKNKDYLNKRYYIRFGGIPKGGISKNHLDNIMEKGLSVYNARFDIETDKWILETDFSEDTITGTMESVLLSKTRKIYLLTGDQIGEGSDSEPVIANAAIVKELSLLDFYIPGIYDIEDMEELYQERNS